MVKLIAQALLAVTVILFTAPFLVFALVRWMAFLAPWFGVTLRHI